MKNARDSMTIDDVVSVAEQGLGMSEAELNQGWQRLASRLAQEQHPEPVVSLRPRFSWGKWALAGAAALALGLATYRLPLSSSDKSLHYIIEGDGGVHATLFPERVLASPAVDYCVRGEGETSFFSLVTALASGLDPGTKGIDGLCFKGSGPPHISPPAVEADIDQLPGRRYIEADRYRIGRKNYAFFLTSRGCPNACSFCGKPPAPYRRRSLRAIEEEIDECARLGIEAVDFEDDMLNLDRRLFHEVLGLFSGRQMTLSAMNGVYPSRMDAPTLEAMHRVGFRRLNFSLVDLSLPVVAAQARASHDSFVRLLPWLDASPFLVEVHFIIGLPSQSPADLLETLCFLMGHRVLLGPSIFYLAPGSPMAASAAEIDIPLRYMRSSVMLPVNPLFPRQVTYTFVKLVRFINYVKTVLDAPDAPLRASDLTAGAAVDEGKRTIVERLLTEKRFVCFDAASRTFHDEPVDAGLVAAFFQKAKGAIIMGFKSRKSLLMDV